MSLPNYGFFRAKIPSLSRRRRLLKIRPTLENKRIQNPSRTHAIKLLIHNQNQNTMPECCDSLTNTTKSIHLLLKTEPNFQICMHDVKQMKKTYLKNLTTFWTNKISLPLPLTKSIGAIDSRISERLGIFCRIPNLFLTKRK